MTEPSFLLPPCSEPHGEWWDKQHTYCTGLWRRGPQWQWGRCSCPCHEVNTIAYSAVMLPEGATIAFSTDEDWSTKTYVVGAEVVESSWVVPTPCAHCGGFHTDLCSRLMQSGGALGKADV